MNKSIKIIKLDINELDDLSGVDAISIVSEPAIEENFMFFSKTQPHMFESYSDYPDGVSNNASRGIELNEKVNNKCATQVGKVRAQQLANKEPISVDTIKRMYSYLSRAEEYYDENDNTACGTISYLLWGGLAAKRWSEAKLKELGLFQGDVDVSTLPNYVNEPSGSLIVKDIYQSMEIDVFGYKTKYFYICPGAISTFQDLTSLELDEDVVGMIRSAAQIADNVFLIEKNAIESGKTSQQELDEAILLVDDFQDLIREIEQLVGRRYNTSYMDNHIITIRSYLKDVYNTIEEDIEMVDGIVELILKIEDLENRKEIVIDTLRDFAEEGVQFDLDLFLQRVGVNLFDEFAEVGPRGGIKASPKAPKSDTPNKDPKGEGTAEGSASGVRGAKVTEAQERTLQKKVDDFNEKDSNTKNGRATLGALKSVFQRGLGAYNTSHSPNVSSAEQWAYARVNAFLYLLKNGRPENEKYTTDYDLLPKDHPKRLEASKQEFVDPRGGESEDDFLGRCIPKLLSEGYDQEQAAAICYSSYRERYEEDKRTIQTYVSRLFQLLGELDGLPVFASPTEASEVAKIAGCEGYHEHQVGEFIVYMPCEEHDPSMDEMLNEAYEEWLKGQEKSWDNLSPEEQSELLKQLEQMGEEDVIFKREFINTSAIRSAAKPDEVSFMDSPNTRIRYKYVGPRDSKNRDFCRFLLDIDKVYRKEDINNMSLAGPNTGFGPGPKNNFYNIFLYKGGKYCRHNWEVITQFFEPKFDKWGRYETTDVQKPFDLLTNPASGLALIGGQVVNPSDIVTSRFSRQEFQDQQIIAGPLMIPDKLIERYDEKDGKYYVYFSEETIKKIAYKFMQKKYTDSTNIEHDSNKTFDDVFVVESWLVADPKRDKSLIYSGGKEYAKGTWYGMMKVKNNLLWNDYIKSGELKGFSVEGFFLDELLNKQSGNFQ